MLVQELDVDELEGRPKRIKLARLKEIATLSNGLNQMIDDECDHCGQDASELRDKVIFNHFELINN